MRVCVRTESAEATLQRNGFLCCFHGVVCEFVLFLPMMVRPQHESPERLGELKLRILHEDIKRGTMDIRLADNGLLRELNPGPLAP